LSKIAIYTILTFQPYHCS